MKNSLEAKLVLDTLTHSFYDLFTNQGGAMPKLLNIYELFIPQGILIKNSGASPEIYSLSQFIEPRKKLLTDGTLVDFREEEAWEKTEIFGNVAHRFSIYHKFGVWSGKRFETRGIKTLQFIKTPENWKLSSVAWDDERDGFEIPSLL